MNRLIVTGKPDTLRAQLADLQRTGLFRNGPPIPSNTTDDELIRDVLSDLGATARERELAERLEEALGDIARLEKENKELWDAEDSGVSDRLHAALADASEYESLYRKEVRKASELQERVDQLEDEIAKGN